MELKLDVKTLMIGIALGVIVTASLGQIGGSADKADFGIAVENRGFALVRSVDGLLYAVNLERAKAELIENEDNRNRPLNLSVRLAPERYDSK
jgi:hypothetical protein